MSRDIGLLHPELQIIANELVRRCALNGLDVLITQTLRTEQEQNALYAQGRSEEGKIVTNLKYPDSAHCWGVAFDFCRNEGGREYDDSDGFFKSVAAIAKPMGLSWGGDWSKFPDKPHLELTRFMPDATVSFLKRTYRTPEEFIRNWSGSPHEVKRYRTINDVPSVFSDTVRRLMEKGILLGDGNEDKDKCVIDLSEDMVRILVFMERAGAFDTSDKAI